MATPEAEWFHHCSACGQCCNSPPELSLAELFQHQDVFFGCLALRRIVLKDVSVAQRALAERVLHPLSASPDRSEWLQLVVLGFDGGARAACPALASDGRCSLHHVGKPKACSAVPLDPWRADEEQAAVLEFRAKDARSWGVDCIQSAAQPLFRPLTRGLRVVDVEAAVAVAARRLDLEQDKALWGREVFRELATELFARPERTATLPQTGFFLMSLAPVLLVVARQSRERVLSYLAAQAGLAEQLLARGEPAAAGLRQLRAFSDTNARLQRALAAQE